MILDIVKTIFFSVSNAVIFRNLASFQGSVLDLLAHEENIKTIVLVRKGQKLPFEFGAHPNILIEEIDENIKRNIIQNAFYFFFSFLIFTDTTKLVSSYGVRADKPRPLWRFWNYPLKIFISKTFGKSEWVKKVLAPKIYLWLFPERLYKNLFEKYRPDLAFLPNICIWPNDLQLLVEAKRRGIKTVGMHGNWDHFSKYFIPFQTDKMLVWSEPVKEEAIKFQSYEQKSVEVVGGPHVDYFIGEASRESRQDFLKRLGFAPDSIVILFASQGPYSLDGADLVEMILNWIRVGELDKKTRLIIRPHPSGIMEKEKYERFQGDPLVYFDSAKDCQLLPGFRHYINVLRHADLLITTYSTVGPDGVLMDRPVIVAGFDGYKKRPIYQSVRRHKNFTHYQLISKIGGIRIVEQQAEFLPAIKDYLANPKRDATERAILRRKIFGWTEGKNSARVIDVIKKTLYNERK